MASLYRRSYFEGGPAAADGNDHLSLRLAGSDSPGPLPETAPGSTGLWRQGVEVKHNCHLKETLTPALYDLESGLGIVSGSQASFSSSSRPAFSDSRYREEEEAVVGDPAKLQTRSRFQWEGADGLNSYFQIRVVSWTVAIASAGGKKDES